MIRVSSIFSQMLQLFSRTQFQATVREHKAERNVSTILRQVVFEFRVEGLVWAGSGLAG